MNDDQFDHIWYSLPKDPDDLVEYREFLRMFTGRTDVTRASSATPPRTRERKVRKNERMNECGVARRRQTVSIVKAPMAAAIQLCYPYEKSNALPCKFETQYRANSG